MTNTRASELQSYTELQSFESRASELQELQSYTELQSFESRASELQELQSFRASNRGTKTLKTP